MRLQMICVALAIAVASIMFGYTPRSHGQNCPGGRCPANLSVVRSLPLMNAAHERLAAVEANKPVRSFLASHPIRTMLANRPRLFGGCGR